MSRATVAEVVNLTHRYGDTIALNSINLTIGAGQTVGFIGPDGVGKSTLLALLAGAREIQHGEVSILGESLRSRRGRNHLYSRIAYMPQGLGKNLYPTLSVYENLDFFARLFGLPKAQRHARILQLLEGTALAEFAARPVGKLSGGMKQKLGLCCALIHDPDCLILDEPTTGIDPLSRRQFWQLVGHIKAIQQHLTILVATASMDEAARFDQLVALYDGKLLAACTPAELMAATATSELERAFIKLLPNTEPFEPYIFTSRSTLSIDADVAIEATNLTMRFGDFTAVKDVSLAVKKGEIFGFLGSNGCGKTTTMKMLTGLLKASSGSATLFGVPVQ